jgi:hypothetical protein
VTLLQAAAKCIDGDRTLAVADFEIKAFNERWAPGCGWAWSLPNNDNLGDAQMIVFPLIATWMWFQILMASPLPFSDRRVGDTSGADVSLLRIPCVV